MRFAYDQRWLRRETRAAAQLVVSVVMSARVVGLVIDSWTTSPSKRYGPTMWCVEIGPPPSFHAVAERSASLRRLGAYQLLQSSKHCLIVGLIGFRFCRGVAENFGTECLCPFDVGVHATLN